VVHYDTFGIVLAILEENLEDYYTYHGNKTNNPIREKKRFEIIHTLTITITGIFTGCNNKSEITGAG